jgi:hypothetical protein
MCALVLCGYFANFWRRTLARRPTQRSRGSHAADGAGRSTRNRHLAGRLPRPHQRFTHHAAPSPVAAERSKIHRLAAPQIGANDSDRRGDVTSAVGKHDLDRFDDERAQLRPLTFRVEIAGHRATGHITADDCVVASCEYRSPAFEFRRLALAENAIAAASDRTDIYSRITAEIVSTIENGAVEWPIARPRNVTSGKGYRGINILALWAAARRGGYASGIWGRLPTMVAARRTSPQGREGNDCRILDSPCRFFRTDIPVLIRGVRSSDLAHRRRSPSTGTHPIASLHSAKAYLRVPIG